MRWDKTWWGFDWDLAAAPETPLPTPAHHTSPPHHSCHKDRACSSTFQPGAEQLPSSLPKVWDFIGHLWLFGKKLFCPVFLIFFFFIPSRKIDYILYTSHILSSLLLSGIFCFTPLLLTRLLLIVDEVSDNHSRVSRIVDPKKFKFPTTELFHRLIRKQDLLFELSFLS